MMSNFSYWEKAQWLSNVDYTIVGSGIVGLNCALQLKKRFPNSNILILERGMLPQGASTKNAGFSCFGSLSELLDDLNSHSPDEVLQLLNKRLEGLRLLRHTLGDHTIDYKELGGYELFVKDDDALYDHCIAQREAINALLKPIFKTEVFQLKPNIFNFKTIKPNYIYNPFEGQINTGKMMLSLLQKAYTQGIKILNHCSVAQFTENNSSVTVKTNHFEFKTSKLFIATNGFASQLLDVPVRPARAQVLVTTPIKDLHIKGTFHLDKGYYYFRNIDNRILLGGGRHLNFKGEETVVFAQTEQIQSQLESLLKTTILPDTPFEIDSRWSGIMGVGTQKKAIVKPHGNHVFCGIRLGGMGVAIGSLVGKELADLI